MAAGAFDERACRMTNEDEYWAMRPTRFIDANPSVKSRPAISRNLKRLLYACLLLLPAAPAARGELLIYHGTGMHFTATQPGWSANERCYVIVDLSAEEISVISYGSYERHKTFEILVDELALDDTLVSEGTKTYEIFSYASHQSPGGGFFADEGVFFRGLESKVNVAGGTGHYTTDSHPLSMAGVFRYTAVGVGSDYDEHNFNLGFNQTLTVNYNNSDLTIDEAQSDIIGVLEGQGYQPF
jgi:hypothetical protein